MSDPPITTTGWTIVGFACLLWEYVCTRHTHDQPSTLMMMCSVAIVPQALKADLIARQFGGRVIMCDTHEPPQRADLYQLVSGSDSEDSEDQEAEEERAANLLKVAKSVGPR